MKYRVTKMNDMICIIQPKYWCNRYITMQYRALVSTVMKDVPVRPWEFISLAKVDYEFSNNINIISVAVLVPGVQALKG